MNLILDQMKCLDNISKTFYIWYVITESNYIYRHRKCTGGKFVFSRKNLILIHINADVTSLRIYVWSATDILMKAFSNYFIKCRDEILIFATPTHTQKISFRLLFLSKYQKTKSDITAQWVLS